MPGTSWNFPTGECMIKKKDFLKEYNIEKETLKKT